MSLVTMAEVVKSNHLGAVFSRQEALAAGVTPAQLRGNAVEAVFRGVYCLAGQAGQPAVRAAAGVKAAGSQALLCGTTALSLLGVELPNPSLLKTVHVWIPAGVGPRMPGIRVHRDRLLLPRQKLPHGLLGANPAECWMHAAETLTVQDLVLLADGLMRRQDPILFLDDLQGAVVNESWRRGVRRARQALSLACPGTDSPMETLLRLALVSAGLPCPEVNTPVRLPGSRIKYWLDMAYPAIKIGIEYNGAKWHVGDARQMQHDETRRRRLEDAGWRIITATAVDVSDPSALIASVRHEMTLRSA